MPECTCRGTNPTCYRCSGTGATRQLSEQRNVSVSDVKRELRAITNRPGKRTRITRREQLPKVTLDRALSAHDLLSVGYVGSAQQAADRQLCPYCRTEIRCTRLDRHINERCPKLKQQRRNALAALESAAPMGAPPFLHAAEAAHVSCPAIPVQPACPDCGVRVSQIRLEGHMKERCPKLKAKRPVTAAVKGIRPKPVAKPNLRVIIISGDESRQAVFERSFIQGGLCRKR